MKKYLLPILAFLLFSNLSLHAQLPFYVPQNGIKAWLDFSGNAWDKSGNSNDAANYGATLVEDRFNNSNSAYSFNNGSGMSISQNGGLDFNSFSIAFWIRLENRNGYLNTVFSKGGRHRSSTIGWRGFEILHHDSTIYFYSGFNGLPVFLNAAINIPDTNWHHLVLTMDSATFNTKIFLDGNIEYLDTIYGYRFIPTNCDLSIGLVNSGGGGANFCGTLAGHGFTGVLDDIGLWDRALNDSEIQDLYTALLTSIKKPEPEFSIYPNPASDFVKINGVHLNVKRIIAYDGLGREYPLIYTARNAIIHVETRSLKSGQYVIKLETENGFYSKKILIE